MQSEVQFQDHSDKKLQATMKIQNAWRSHTNRKIYNYYRDILLLKSQTKPTHLLKSVNPNEAQLLEKGSNMHVRFRLGGERFPPNIYYKIYCHHGIIDMNSFAPRDYSQQKGDKKVDTKMYFRDYKDQKVFHDGWYIRQENNGWRPLYFKPQDKTDYVELVTSQKVKYFHHDPELRKKKNEKQKRLNKLRWFQTMFEKARQEEALLQGQPNPFENADLIDMEDGDFDKEVDDLIEWSDNLDYEKYTDNWKNLSTTEYTAANAYNHKGVNASFIQTEFEYIK